MIRNISIYSMHAYSKYISIYKYILYINSEICMLFSRKYFLDRKVSFFLFCEAPFMLYIKVNGDQLFLNHGHFTI